MRNTYSRAREVFSNLYQPTLGKPFAFEAIDVAPSGEYAIATGIVQPELSGRSKRSLYKITLSNGQIEKFWPEGDTAALAKHSPNGKCLAFLSSQGGRQDLLVVDLNRASQPSVVPVRDGIVETFEWSSDSLSILMVIASFGADIAASAGSNSITDPEKKGATWMPEFTSHAQPKGWRYAATWRVGEEFISIVSPKNTNIWEASWMGRGSVAVIASDSPEERGWYDAELFQIDAAGAMRLVYSPRAQIGVLRGEPDGDRIAFIEAISSDRGVVCGTGKLIDNDVVQELSSGGVDISDLHWTAESTLAFAGVKRSYCVLGAIDPKANEPIIHYKDQNRHAGFYYPFVSPHPKGGVVFSAHGFVTAPTLEVATCGVSEKILSLSHAGAEFLSGLVQQIEVVSWTAPDGLEIEGWLILPSKGQAPYPLVMEVHGGPVWVWRPTFLLHMPLIAALLSEGFAVFLPNPRGSTGRGPDFVVQIKGDMGGADTLDFVSGVEALIGKGIADVDRIYVTGSSYGGFVSAWLATQSNRFAAVAPRCPVVNWASQHWTSNIAEFDSLFLSSDVADIDGKHFSRSPVNFAGQVKCPVLIIAGALDKCTPPEQGEEFFSALCEAGGDVVLAVYPNEGHGFHSFDSRCDVAGRIADWFSRQSGNA